MAPEQGHHGRVARPPCLEYAEQEQDCDRWNQVRQHFLQIGEQPLKIRDLGRPQGREDRDDSMVIRPIFVTS